MECHPGGILRAARDIHPARGQVYDRFPTRSSSVLALVLVGALLLGGCGKPAYNYVANSNVKTYFKVPSDWSTADTNVHDYEFAQILFDAQNEDSQAFVNFKRVRWSVEYDSPFDEQAGLDGPMAYGLVTPVPSFVQNGISLDAMRDLLAPVSQAAQAQAISSGQGLPPGFEVLDDELLTPQAGMRGVRVVYNRSDAMNVLRTYDLTVMTNNDSTLVYILIVWCSTRCYRQKAIQINDVVTSFTVRSAP
jgi:hypothetical protein